MDDKELEIAFELMGEKLGGRSGSNRSVKCPLAPWTHTKGKDSSASLMAKAADPSVYRCWACSNQGTVKTLARMYREHSGDGRAFDFVSSVEGDTNGAWRRMSNLSYDEIKRRQISKFHHGLEKNEKNESPISEKELAEFLKQVPKYALDRGITKEQIIEWEIGFDAKEARMVIPVRDYLGRLCGVSGRDVTGTKKIKYRHYPGFKKELVMYGEHKIDRSFRMAYLVEGFMDVLALQRLGLKNALATMGTTISDAQMVKLARFFTNVTMIPDVDDAGYGMKFCQEYGMRLAMKIPRVTIAGVRLNPKYERRVPPRNWEPSDYKYVAIDVLKSKDPADLSADDLKEVLATEVVVDYV